ncbi:GNAT family N-acetyltransferase [Oceanihabitans sp. 2_MG-2023]|uniref:GNAT family N-acetyltransferase n=1 Tax=Oceanihabitans sp. 2_MG-2023 TaxID=3062661 RepID=UPI0026E37642|nr:GNAT family N-acetyltransferase [Oceanihabitans sp. 2_MG-2023]MDO6596507.1 GNAT family N-acetyltransferase [Oceanihabitans sp. 2_MG-2023]
MMVAKTQRLTLSKFTLEDAAFFLELVNTPHWLKYIGDRNTKTIQDAENRIKEGHLKSYNTNGFGFYVLRLNESNTPIGTCGLIKRETLDHVDIGFAMLPDYEKKGFGYEASLAVLKLAKETFKLKKIVAITLPTNTPSIKLLEKLGLSYQKKVKPFEDDEELLLFAKTLNK